MNTNMYVLYISVSIKDINIIFRLNEFLHILSEVVENSVSPTSLTSDTGYEGR